MTFQKRTSASKQRRERSRRWCSQSFKNVLQLLLPLMLGVFTIVITFQQLTISRDQRWNISQMAQAVQSRTVIEQYRDELLVAYIKGMGDLLKSRNGSVNSGWPFHLLRDFSTLVSLARNYFVRSSLDRLNFPRWNFSMLKRRIWIFLWHDCRMLTSHTLTSVDIRHRTISSVLLF